MVKVKWFWNFLVGQKPLAHNRRLIITTDRFGCHKPSRRLIAVEAAINYQ